MSFYFNAPPDLDFLMNRFFQRMHFRILCLENYLSWLLSIQNLPESIYFFTFHKCASTLFGGYVLKKIKGLRHVDYELRFTLGRQNHPVTFEKRGCIYGPIRLSTGPESPAHEALIVPTTRADFLKDKTALFFMRDPRDILVSAYYSFGYSHPVSQIEEIKKQQEQQRRRILGQTVDDFATGYAPAILKNFEKIEILQKSCSRSSVLRYEDMILDWDKFTKELSKCIKIRRRVLSRIYRKSRPRNKEEIGAHRRSGKTEGFRNSLKPQTVKNLNDTFRVVLDRYQYPP